ncbi:hypothetical protein AO269_26675 [Pseudomonas putida]|nr:hypothetical protein AO269_26675 [Pseudomonas putida]
MHAGIGTGPVVAEVVAIGIVQPRRINGVGTGDPSSLAVINEQPLQLRQRARPPLHQVAQPLHLRRGGAVDLNPLDEPQQHGIRLLDGVFSMLRQ